MKVTKGDNGNILSFTVKDDKGIVNLIGANVNVLLSVNNAAEISKQATILDAAAGQCEALLDGNLFTKEGVARVRVCVEFNADKKFNSDLQQIIIEN